MMNLENRQISVEVANKLAAILKNKGVPAPGRLLLVSPTGEQTTTGGILIPGTTNEKDLPRKGVVVQFNQVDSLEGTLQVGVIITYGMYAGKELQFNPQDVPFLDLNNYKFTILSESEVIYIESNN